MGKKSGIAAAAGEADISAAPACNKSKKKTHIIDDDEYSIVTDLSDNMQMPGVQKEAKKKGKKAAAAEESGDAPSMVFSGEKKYKGKKGNASDLRSSDFDVLEEENDAMEIDESEDAPVIAFAGKKKPFKSSKKSNSVFSASNFNSIGGGGDNTADIALNSTNDNNNSKPSKSPKKSNSVFSASAIGGDNDGTADIALNSTNANDSRVEDEEDVPAISFSRKKKSSKSSKKSNSLFTASSFVGGVDDDEASTDVTMSSTSKLGDEDNDGSQISFSGKKYKPSKKNHSLFTASGFDTVVDDATDGIIGDNQVDNEDDAEMIAFSGKKKSSKKSGRSFIASGFDTVLGEEDSGVTEPEQPSMDCSISSCNEANRKNESDGKYNKQGSESVVGPSKNQKKGKKKSGKTGKEEEEDDLDKILAELGKGPPLPKPTAPLPEEKFQVPPEPVKPPDIVVEEKNTEVEEKEGGESAAAKKKKKKKKDKEKEKKAAVVAAAAAMGVEATKEEKQDEKKSKISDQKIPKHVREMQEVLARRKEAEERLKKEEEEKLRREEEERRMQEEQERLAEEARRRKKEREKEKLLKKKQEGKLLTHKQKEEAKRLELMRKQYLGDKAQLPIAKIETPSCKRPKFEKRKAKPGPLHGHSGAAAEVVETVEVLENKLNSMPPVFESPEVEMVDEESSIINIEQRVVEENEIEEDDDIKEWDAKSWDDVDIILPAKSAFPEEEAESMVKKDTKHLTASHSMNAKVPPPPANPTITTKKAALPILAKSQDTRSKGEDHEVEKAKEKTQRKEAAAEQEQFVADSLSKRSADNLRSPICCILGHVDTGKTKLLDCIRGTNVQEGEAGGITQQIGATYFPAENIRERTKELKADAKLRVPGLLVIDTPGHESFTNLRSRGSGLCDIAILVVDIMHGLEPQTIESINLLKMRKTEFIVALNKVDRLYGWKTCPNAPIVKAMKQQSRDVQNEFKTRLTQIIMHFKEQGLNTELYYKNREMGETFSIVPTSAVSGTGIPDLLLLLTQYAQKTMDKKLMFVSDVQCTVLEVKVIEGLGTTVDVVLINGVLREGDQIVVCGMQGPIVTTIRSLLTPHPMKELQVKGSYQHHKELKAAQGIKITAQGLEHAIAGTGLYVVGPGDDVEFVKEAAMQDMNAVMSRIDKSGEGVSVQASTLGSLEALLEFLRSPAVNIPVSGTSIGPVHKRDVMRASVMLERKKEYGTILAFDVKVTPEARELADETGVKIFIADIIYHLFDQFKAYIDNLKEEKKKETAEEAVFPCVLKIMPDCIFNKKDPIVVGVDILDGIAKVGTPICIPSRGFIDIGQIASIEINHKQVNVAKKGQQVAIKIVGSNPEEQQKMFGRHFDINDELVSHISSRSIDILEANYKDDLSSEEWKLVKKLKKLFLQGESMRFFQ
ncbi:hypothetical protein AAC387_Pa01g1082 [Persea americana]